MHMSGESNDHSLHHCKISSASQNSILGLYGLDCVMPRYLSKKDCVMPRRMVYLFAYWRGQFGSLHSVAV
jgi:hypothetical protein